MKYFVVLMVVLLVFGGIYLSLLTPSHDRNWQEHFIPTYDASIEEDDTVVLSLVRDWQHDVSGATSKEWLKNVRIHPTEVERVWFIITSIGESKFVAHSFVSFELKDGRAYSFSIEARREEGEDYSAFMGLFNKYELAYSWGTERDFIGVRRFFLDYHTEIYPLELSSEQAGALFTAMAKATAQVADEPRFYNTLTANCTNLLAEAVNSMSPDRLPYDLSWHLPALSIGYLMEQGFIDSKGLDAKSLRQQSSIDDFTNELKKSEDFSATLRELYEANN